jgi:hypothetical protein
MSLIKIRVDTFIKSINLNRKLKYKNFGHYTLSDNINGQIQFISSS